MTVSIRTFFVRRTMLPALIAGAKTLSCMICYGKQGIYERTDPPPVFTENIKTFLITPISPHQ